MARQGWFARLAMVSGVLVMLALVVGATQATQAPAPPPPLPAATDTAGLLTAFRRVEVASVSDAMEQLYGKRVYMSHRMRPLAFSGNAARAAFMGCRAVLRRNGADAFVF